MRPAPADSPGRGALLPQAQWTAAVSSTAVHGAGRSKGAEVACDKASLQVYIETQPLIRSVVDGYNVCIFAYGQTGSGKTHTMSGSNVETVSGRGINYRALDDLFDLQHQRRAEVKYDIRVQMLEVYNEKARST
jgi:Kinesin motor domain